MAHSLSPNDIKHLPCTQAAQRHGGNRDRYIMDAAIRHYQPLGLAAINADLGTDHQSVSLRGGIGALMLSPTQTRFFSSVKHLDQPSTTDPATIARRRTLCSTCEHLVDSTCQLNACGCGSAGKTDHAAGACPIGQW